MALKVIMNWGVGSFFGWGVYGLNLALAWAADPDVAAACPYPLLEREVVVDSLRRAALGPFARRSAELRREILGVPPTRPAITDVPVLMALDQRFEVGTVEGVSLRGKPSVGVTFFQDTHLTPAAVERARAYPLMLAGSSWNAKLLEAHGLENVRTVLQGVDPTLFHPADRQRLFPDRFLVFSGGKLERRKGQDIVLAGFRQFASRHPDALLVTAWDSPFPSEARSLNGGQVVSPVTGADAGKPDPRAWAIANGIRPEQILTLGAVPNAAMPTILREMDLAVFPNRGEGGTNLVAMEAMACGVPTVLSRNTGHLDLIEEDNCYTLDVQRELGGLEGPFNGVPGWGESDPNELADVLEHAYADRETAAAVSARGAETLRHLSWATTARQLKSILLDFSTAR